MVMYKVFAITLAIILSNPDSKQSILLNQSDNIIYLNKKDYFIIDYSQDSVRIGIKKKRIIRRIQNSECPTFVYRINSKECVGKGLRVLSSELPYDCDYVYLCDMEGKVMSNHSGQSFIITFILLSSYKTVDYLRSPP